MGTRRSSRGKMKQLFISLVLGAALLILAGVCFHSEGVTLGKLSAYGCVSVALAGKTLTVGACPVRHNRLYYRLAIQ